MATSKPGKIHERIVEVMKRFPDGITGGQIRQELSREGLRPEDQIHLDRRKRDLKKWYVIEIIPSTQIVSGVTHRVALYKYIGKRKKITDEYDINIRVKFEVRRAAYGRCQMCGKTIADDGIKLIVDLRKPRAWGGTNDPDNLWAICEDCDARKQVCLNSMAPDFGKRVTADESIHLRIGETLKAAGVGGKTPHWLLEVVADQEDWRKRLHELRSAKIGSETDKIGYKTKFRRQKVDYVLRSYRPWPPDPTGNIRSSKANRQRRNKTREPAEEA